MKIASSLKSLKKEILTLNWSNEEETLHNKQKNPKFKARQG